MIQSTQYCHQRQKYQVVVHKNYLAIFTYSDTSANEDNSFRNHSR